MTGAADNIFGFLFVLGFFWFLVCLFVWGFGFFGFFCFAGGRVEFEMMQMEFLFVLWGTKKISRLLALFSKLYFLWSSDILTSSSFSEILSYGLKTKSTGEHLKKTEVRVEISALHLPCFNGSREPASYPDF